MAKDDEGYADKPVSPDSRSDPRAQKGAPEGANPLARETYPGGAGTPEQIAAAKGKAKAKKDE